MTALELARAVIAEDAEYDRAGYADNALVLLHRAPTRDIARALLSLHAECERMRTSVGLIVTSMEGAIDRVEHNRQRRNSGGQHVGPSGEFSSVPPSGLIAMREYVEALKAALDASAKEKS